MHDIRLIRDDPDAFDAALARRGHGPVAADILALDTRHRAITTRVQEAQSRRNFASKAIGQAIGKGDQETAEKLKAEVAELKQTMPQLEEEGRELDAKLSGLLDTIPNLPADDVPEGESEDDNVEVARWSEPRSFDFEPQEHADLGPALGMDFETGAKISGARFTFLRGSMARLHRALAQFMLDRQVSENGYTECYPPVLVNDAAMYGTDKLPKFAEDSYAIVNEFAKLRIALEASQSGMELIRQADIFNQKQSSAIGSFVLESRARGIDVSGLEPILNSYAEHFNVTIDAYSEYIDGFQEMANRFNEMHVSKQSARQWLIPTAEVSLTASVMGEIIDDLSRPIRLTALTPCFRSEAGAAGKDTRGFIRQHQFEKVELVSICRPEDSEAEHERMTQCAEGVLQALDLPYRKLLLCTGDMGFGARKTYDLEVWLPGQGAYREISSCSNTGNFQARRMNTRYRPQGEKKTDFVHTLNGSGLAVGRTLVAVLENYQNADGSVAVPDALKAYMGGVEKLEPAS